MGGWKLEVGKMAMYITFPVAMFHYFNQPEFFEEWVVKTKREILPPDHLSGRIELEAAIKKIKQEQELASIQALESSEANRK